MPSHVRALVHLWIQVPRQEGKDMPPKTRTVIENNKFRSLTKKWTSPYNNNNWLVNHLLSLFGDQPLLLFGDPWKSVGSPHFALSTTGSWCNFSLRSAGHPLNADEETTQGQGNYHNSIYSKIVTTCHYITYKGASIKQLYCLLVFLDFFCDGSSYTVATICRFFQSGLWEVGRIWHGKFINEAWPDIFKKARMWMWNNKLWTSALGI